MPWNTIVRTDWETGDFLDAPIVNEQILDNLEFLKTMVEQLIPVGTVMPMAIGSSPPGYLICDGSEISRAAFTELFAAIGTTYGVGDGSTTYNLPDLRGRFPMGRRASGAGSTLGETGGSFDHAHTGPSHTHSGPSHTHAGDSHTHSVGSHTHGNPNTSTTGNHAHTAGNTGAASGVAEFGAGSGFLAASGSHVHDAPDTGSAGNHAHSQGSTGSGGSGSTGAGGSGATGAGGTGQTGASGTAATGVNNPPYQVFVYMIKVSADLGI